MNTLIEQPLEPGIAHDRSRQDQSSVVAHLSYLAPSTERPFSYTYEPPAGVPWENCE